MTDIAIKKAREAVEESRAAAARLGVGLPRAQVDAAMLERLIRLAEGTAQQQRIEALEAALNQIAAWQDKQANEKLKSTGSYGSFDEPGAVKIAREALNEATRIAQETGQYD